eukprot:gene7353-biopygen16546
MAFEEKSIVYVGALVSKSIPGIVGWNGQNLFVQCGALRRFGAAAGAAAAALSVSFCVEPAPKKDRPGVRGRSHAPRLQTLGVGRPLHARRVTEERPHSAQRLQTVVAE